MSEFASANSNLTSGSDGEDGTTDIEEIDADDTEFAPTLVKLGSEVDMVTL